MKQARRKYSIQPKGDESAQSLTPAAFKAGFLPKLGNKQSLAEFINEPKNQNLSSTWMGAFYANKASSVRKKSTERKRSPFITTPIMEQNSVETPVA